MIICGAPNGALHKNNQKSDSMKIIIKGLENHNPIQQLINKLSDSFGRYGSVWYFLGIQTFFIHCMPNSFLRPTWKLSAFSFSTFTFLRINWSKKITASHKFGFEIPAGVIKNYNKNEYQTVTEARGLYLYNPFKIISSYHISAEDDEVVVKDHYGDSQIETHEFQHVVCRKRFIWWNDYRIVDRWKNDETKFDQQLDSYLTGGQ